MPALPPVVLHSSPRSSNAQKVRFLLRILGEPFELRDVPYRDRPEWHLEVNPTGGIPALVDGDLRLAESHAMLRYLAARAGSDLYPADIRERASVEWLLDHIATWFRPAAFRIEEAAFGIRPGHGLFADPPAPERLPEIVAALGKRFAATERLLGPAPWATLGRLTIADVAAGPVLHRLARSGADLSAHPRLEAWIAAVTAHPDWVAMADETGV